MGEIVYDKFGVLKGVKYDFMTMNNKVDASMLNVEKGESPAIINMIPTVRGSVFTRKGYQQITSGHFLGSWSNGNGAYLIADNWLKFFDGTNIVDICSIAPESDYDFCEVNDVVVFSNGIDYLILSGATAYQPALPNMPFKVAPVAGTALEFYNGRVYIARNEILYCTDPFTTEWMDERSCIAAAFDCKITLVRRVDDGLYVSTEKELFFIEGDDPFTEASVKLDLLANVGAIQGTAIRTNGDAFPVAEMQGSLVVFATDDGVMVGGNGGAYKNLSFDKISYSHGANGAGLLYEYNGNTYYLVSLVSSGTEKNKYTIPTFSVDQQEV